MPPKNRPENPGSGAFNLDIIRFLLAGMYFVLGLSGFRRDVFREQALRLRRAEAETGHVDRSLKKAENHINAWSGDHARHWRTRLQALSNDPQAPDIIFKSWNIVCRLRNAQAPQLKPKHHSLAFLTLRLMPQPGHDYAGIYKRLLALPHDGLESRGVRAPP